MIQNFVSRPLANVVQTKAMSPERAAAAFLSHTESSLNRGQTGMWRFVVQWPHTLLSVQRERKHKSSLHSSSAVWNVALSLARSYANFIFPVSSSIFHPPVPRHLSSSSRAPVSGLCVCPQEGGRKKTTNHCTYV